MLKVLSTLVKAVTALVKVAIAVVMGLARAAGLIFREIGRAIARAPRRLIAFARWIGSLDWQAARQRTWGRTRRTAAALGAVGVRIYAFGIFAVVAFATFSAV